MPSFMGSHRDTTAQGGGTRQLIRARCSASELAILAFDLFSTEVRLTCISLHVRLAVFTNSCGIGTIGLLVGMASVGFDREGVDRWADVATLLTRAGNLTGPGAEV
jgi:hypothetical protein